MTGGVKLGVSNSAPKEVNEGEGQGVAHMRKSKRESESVETMKPVKEQNSN